MTNVHISYVVKSKKSGNYFKAFLDQMVDWDNQTTYQFVVYKDLASENHLASEPRVKFETIDLVEEAIRDELFVGHTKDDLEVLEYKTTVTETFTAISI